LPFTLAHPAAVVPLAKKRLVFSALVVGTITPDFEYFLRLAPISRISHSLLGLLVFCLPAGLLMLWLWHVILKNALVELLPDSHYRRLLPLCGPFRFRPMSRFALIVVSVLVGAFTHIAWDSFTHHYGWGVQHLAALRTALIETGYGPLRLYNVLQHGSTLVGMVALAALYVRWFRDGGAAGNASSPLSLAARLWTIASALSGAGVVAVVYAWASTPPRSLQSFNRFVATMVLVGMCALWAELTAFGLWRYFSRGAQGRSESVG